MREMTQEERRIMEIRRRNKRMAAMKRRRQQKLVNLCKIIAAVMVFASAIVFVGVRAFAPEPEYKSIVTNRDDAQPSEMIWAEYIVKKGDTLIGISTKLIDSGITEYTNVYTLNQRIISKNYLRSDGMVELGDRLLVPVYRFAVDTDEYYVY